MPDRICSNQLEQDVKRRITLSYDLTEKINIPVFWTCRILSDNFSYLLSWIELPYWIAQSPLMCRLLPKMKTVIIISRNEYKIKNEQQQPQLNNLMCRFLFKKEDMKKRL